MTEVNNAFKFFKANKSLSIITFLLPLWIISANDTRYYIGLIISSSFILLLIFFGNLKIISLLRSIKFQLSLLSLIIMLLSIIGAANIFNFEKTLIYIIRVLLPFLLIYFILYSHHLQINAKYYLEIYIFSLIFFSSIEFINATFYALINFDPDFVELYYDIKKTSLFSNDSNWWAIILFPTLLIQFDRLSKEINFKNISIFSLLLFFLVLTFSKTTLLIIGLYIFIEFISFLLEKKDRNLFSILTSLTFFFICIFLSLKYPFANTRFDIINNCFNFYNDARATGILFGLGTDGFPKQYYHNAHILCGAFVEYGIFYILMLGLILFSMINKKSLKFIVWILVVFTLSLFPVAQIATVLFPLILFYFISNDTEFTK